MKLIFTGSVISYDQQLNVESQIVQYLPVTLSLAIGAGIIWLLDRDRVRRAERLAGGPVPRPRADGVRR